MPRKRRRDSSEVSCTVKYLMFGFNVLFWLLGAGICAIGLWAWTEKDTFTNIGRLTNVALDPAMLFIITGGVMFIIGFAGCVGALRENTKLLLFFCVCVGLIFFLELVIGILAFVYKNWVSDIGPSWSSCYSFEQGISKVKDQIESQLNNMIINYRDDPDLQNLVDWVQKDWLQCCGVSGYDNWKNNIYFNCSSPGVEACGVPFSCCKPTDEAIVNRHCGFDMMKTDKYDRGTYIYTEGCIPAGERWLEKNLIPVASVAVGIAVLQILGICFAHNLRSDIQAQRSKWRM